MKENQAGLSVQEKLADLLFPAEDADFDSLAGEKGFYILASLALGEILKKAPLRQSAVSKHSPERPPNNASVH